MKLNKIFKSVTQMVSSGLLVKLLTILQAIILMKVLDPYDFGIVAIGLTFLLILSRFQSIGISEALIADKDLKDKSSNFSTLFCIRLPLSIFLFTLAFFFSPYWANLYNDEAITDVVRILSLSLLIKSFGIVSKTSLEIDLEFGKLAKISIIESAVKSLSIIFFAFQGYGYFSIIFGHIISSIIETALFLYYSPWWPKFEFNYIVAKKYIAYGKWIFLASLLYSILSSYDAFLIGKYLSLVDLGLYAVSLRWGYLSLLHVTPHFQKVLFTALSSKEYNTDIKSSYLKSNFVIAIITFPVTVGIIFIAEDLLFAIAGEKWLNAVMPLRIMAICGLVRSFIVADPIFASENRPQYQSYTLMLSLLFIFIFLYFSIIWQGLIGATLCITFTFLLHYLYSHYFLNKILRINLIDIFYEIVKPFLASMIMLLTLNLTKNMIYNFIQNDIISLIAIICVGMATYFFLIYYTLKEEILSKISS
mgnify:CR=1 FL=1|tara:strand:- start:6380 stop:7807 length:1428 start_codon:yes stop_codon:yes gene_type:complete